MFFLYFFELTKFLNVLNYNNILICVTIFTYNFILEIKACDPVK